MTPLYAPPFFDALVGATLYSENIFGAPGYWVSVKSFDAKGNGASDDTLAFQRAINYCTLSSGNGIAFNLYVPRGTYRITSKLNIPSSYGFSIKGEGRETTTILQATDGATILYMDTAAGSPYGHRSFVWEGLKLQYVNQQTSGNGSAKAIDCAGFNWKIRDFAFDKCHRAIYNLVDINGRNGAWGIALENIIFGSMSGASVIYEYLGNGDNGFPNNTISQCYVTGSSNPTEDSLILRNWNTFTIDCFEINNWNGRIAAFSGCSGRIGAIRLENPDSQYLFDTVATPRLFNIQNSNIDITALQLSFQISTTNGALKVFEASGASDSSTVAIKSLSIGSNGAAMIPNGGLITLFASTCASLGMTPGLAASLPEYFQLYDNASSGDFDKIEFFPGKNRQVSIGDANLTLSAMTEQVIKFSSTLSVDRSITLPNLYANKLVNGSQEWCIVRDAPTPGAFTLNLKNSAGSTIASIAPNMQGIIKFRQNRFGWVITSKYQGATL